MSVTPVTTSRRTPAERILPDDRVRHCDGHRTGICEAILKTGECVVHWDSDERETLLPGFLERIPPVGMSAS